MRPADHDARWRAAPTGGRSPTRTCEPLVAIYREGRAGARLRHRHRAGARSAARRRRSSCSASSAIRSGVRTPGGGAYRLSDLELASRLSFFLWRSIPDDELLDVADARPAEGPARASSSRCGGMLADERSTRFMNDFSEQWLEVRNVQSTGTRTRFCSRASTTRCATRCCARPSCSSRARCARIGRPGSAARRLHVPQRAARRATTGSRTSTAATSGA